VFEQEEQRFSAAGRATTSSSDSVNIIIRIIWGVKLDDPVNFREVETSLCNVGAKQNSFLCLTELKVGARSLLLLLFSVNVGHGNVYVIKEIGVELDSIARRHKDHNFFLQVLPEEGKEQAELLLRVSDDVALLEVGDCRRIGVLCNFDKDWIFE